MGDLITLSRALTGVQGITPAQQAQIPALISAAADAAERFCNRKFLVSSYDEMYNGDSTGAFILRNFPVVSVERISAGLQTALMISNSNTSNYYRATANIVASTESIPSGLKITSYGTGGETVFFDFSTYTTVSSLANAINTHGNGWKAVCEDKYRNWSTLDFRPVQGVESALGVGARFKIHGLDLGNYYVDQGTGEVRLQSSNYWLPTMYGETSPAWPDSPFVYGFHSLRVQYTAGFTSVPEAVQQAVVFIIQDMFISTNVFNGYKKVKLFDYEYELADGIRNSIPPDAQKLLWMYKDFRASGDY